MGATFLTWIPDALRAAGVAVVEYDGWQTRARSSGGYDPAGPLCVMWHHTASRTAPANDANYMCHVSDSRPIANLLVARDGTVWVLAAGRTNTNGRGNPMRFSRGTVAADTMNNYAVGMEIANGGYDDPFPQVQIDAAFTASNVINARVGNRPDDVAGHHDYAPGRKIDPNNNVSVQGPWRPRSDGTTAAAWLLADLRAECVARATAPAPLPPEPEPVPEPEPEDDVKLYLVSHPDGRAWYVSDMATFKTYVGDPVVGAEGITLFAWQSVQAAGPIDLGPGWGPFLDSLDLRGPA